MNAAYICDAVRTPIGRYGGALATVRADDLAAIPIRALLERNPSLDPSGVEEVVLGCANQAGEDNRNVARMSALLAGLPIETPGVTVNRLCASGAEAVGSAARAIVAGSFDVAIAGGVESMSRAPFVMPKAAAAWQRSAVLEDTTIGWRMINPVMEVAHGVDSMPQTAENVADAHGVSRAEQDSYAARSQELAEAARASGFLSAEITAVHVPGRDQMPPVEVDEHPRAGTTQEALARLRSVVRPGGSVTAGNSSGVNDGAAAMLVTSEVGAVRHGLKPRARVLGMATAGVEPRVMGVGPVPATQKLVNRLGLRMADFDHIEINEAFAAQVIASLRALNIQPDDPRVNPNGGAIALGHPLGMSGARLIMTATHALEQNGGGRALVTMCIGVGQGLALALELV